MPQGGGRWNPLPQGDYDDGATAFVQLPEGGVDALMASADSPLAAPGHGYVPPQIAVAPATTAGADPADTGNWALPSAPVDGAQWHVPEDRGGAPGQEYAGGPEYAVRGDHAATGYVGRGYPEQPPGREHTGQEHGVQGGPEPLHPGYGHPGYGHQDPYGTAQDPYGTAQGHVPDDRFTYPAGTDTGQWDFSGDAGQSAPAPGHDVTGQWSIPVADGDLPDDSGEFAASALAGQWGGNPPDTLPGGAPAPWAARTAEPLPAEPLADGPDPAGPPPAEPPPAGPVAGAPVPGGPGSGDVPSDPAPAGPSADGPLPTGPVGGVEGADRAEDAGRAPGAPAGPDTESDPASKAADEPVEPPAAGAAPEPAADAAGPAHEDGAAPAPDDAPQDTPHGTAEDAPAPGAAPGPGPTGTTAPGTPPGADGDDTTGADDTVADGSPAGAGPVGEDPGPAPDAAPGPEPGSGSAPGDGTAPADGTAPGDGTTPGDAAAHPGGDVPEDAPGTEAQAPPAAGTPSTLGPQDEHPLASYVLSVNGTDRPVTDAWIGESLLYVLRERLGLAGAKDGCSQGECGACNVQVDGRLVASCLVPAVTAAGSEVRTVEGLAVDGNPSDVQRALARCGAVQCGFCVPGMAMTVHNLLEGNPAPTELETRQALCGNLCRCSGYRGVLQAVNEVVAERGTHAAAPGAEGDEARIPHQAGPGAGGVNPSAFGSPPAHDERPRPEGPHPDGPGPDGTHGDGTHTAAHDGTYDGGTYDGGSGGGPYDHQPYDEGPPGGPYGDRPHGREGGHA
ncbi:hypothetical protein GTY84_09695 [Streptomyces sp. SID8352]|nr:(2Fe-2S)-binding protein [Streptomyces sp. SID8352]MYU22095.1 hypothetical protein [Streptomyces sp. SID8352]